MLHLVLHLDLGEITGKPALETNGEQSRKQDLDGSLSSTWRREVMKT
ncbi:hypothetical protein BDA96_01G006600 [Sorghum bicolor]|uniref:Uncharacterized protein n=1 Tax=Sorghum bicolor TaxID=4558 RepID=A0A921RU96_SORBI|nr:hypothetical protein BDA96_01G006600 [Sorghum bicolor]